MAIAENIKELNRLHQQGQRLQASWTQAKREGRLDELLIAEQLTINVARKSKQFSRSYNEDQLRDLLNSLRKYDNRTFGIAHVIQLMAVTDLKKRRRFQQQAIRLAWTSRSLETEIRASHGGRPSRPSGRKHHIESEHPVKELQKLNARAESTRKHLVAVQPVIDEWIESGSWIVTDRTGAVSARELLDQAEKSVESLAHTASAVIRKLKVLKRNSLTPSR